MSDSERDRVDQLVRDETLRDERIARSSQPTETAQLQLAASVTEKLVKIFLEAEPQTLA
jgi:hypothetical protein